MGTLANLLTQIGQLGPFADRTGLDGVYDFRLSWDEDGGPPLAAALQLGGIIEVKTIDAIPADATDPEAGDPVAPSRIDRRLRLERQKVPVSYLVIDSAKKPTAN